MTDLAQKIYQRWFKSESARSRGDEEASLFQEAGLLADPENQVPYKLEPKRSEEEQILSRIRRCGW